MPVVVCKSCGTRPPKVGCAEGVCAPCQLAYTCVYGARCLSPNEGWVVVCTRTGRLCISNLRCSVYREIIQGMPQPLLDFPEWYQKEKFPDNR